MIQNLVTNINSNIKIFDLRNVWYDDHAFGLFEVAQDSDLAEVLHAIVQALAQKTSSTINIYFFKDATLVVVITPSYNATVYDLLLIDNADTFVGYRRVVVLNRE